MSRTLDLPQVCGYLHVLELQACSLFAWDRQQRALIYRECTAFDIKSYLLSAAAQPEICAAGMQDANLWDVSSAPTIVMTQRGARKDFQESLRAKGVEVVQFDFLTPEAVAAYCQERGFLQVRVTGYEALC